MRKWFGFALFCIIGCAPQSSSSPGTSSKPIPPEYNADGRPNTSAERRQAVTDQMVKQGVSREDAKATTDAVYDAERDHQRKNP